MVRDVIKQLMTESPGLELSTTTIERSDIARQGAKTVIDAMEYIPGVLVETRGRSALPPQHKLPAGGARYMEHELWGHMD